MATCVLPLMVFAGLPDMCNDKSIMISVWCKPIAVVIACAILYVLNQSAILDLKYIFI